MAGISHVSGAGFDTDVPVLPTAGVASDGTTPVAHITGDEISRAASSKLTLLSDVDLHVSAGDSIAGMSVADKVATTARAGIAIAAKDAGGAVGTFLKDPKNDAMLLGGTAALAGVQAIPGLDAGVDATLGVVGVAMYASAGPSHRANVTTALGNSRTMRVRSAAQKRKPISTRPRRISRISLRSAARRRRTRWASSPVPQALRPSSSGWLKRRRRSAGSTASSPPSRPVSKGSVRRCALRRPTRATPSPRLTVGSQAPLVRLGSAAIPRSRCPVVRRFAIQQPIARAGFWRHAPTTQTQPREGPLTSTRSLAAIRSTCTSASRTSGYRTA